MKKIIKQSTSKDTKPSKYSLLNQRKMYLRRTLNHKASNSIVFTLIEMIFFFLTKSYPQWKPFLCTILIMGLHPSRLSTRGLNFYPSRKLKKASRQVGSGAGLGWPEPNLDGTFVTGLIGFYNGYFVILKLKIKSLCELGFKAKN